MRKGSNSLFQGMLKHSDVGGIDHSRCCHFLQLYRWAQLSAPVFIDTGVFGQPYSQPFSILGGRQLLPCRPQSHQGLLYSVLGCVGIEL